MPLLDHFHGPLSKRGWISFHNRWSVAIADDLNRRLPNRFFAEAPLYLGSTGSADVGEYEFFDTSPSTNGAPSGGDMEKDGGISVATELYAPPATELTMSGNFPAEIKVEVKDKTRDYRVIGVVEFVSPGNKKEASEREQFVAKCLGYLGRGLGLVVIDIVTDRPWNLHNEMIRVAERGKKYLMPGNPPTYASSYHPVHRNKEDLIDLWLWPLAVGTLLPAVPLALKGFGCVRLDLEATYTEACERSRIG